MTRPTFTIELASDARFAKDLAAGGVFVAARGFRVLDEIDLVVRGIAGELRLHARVVYIDPATGCGLELVGFGPAIKEQLAQLASTPAEIAVVAATKQRRQRVLTSRQKRSPDARDIAMLELDDLADTDSIIADAGELDEDGGFVGDGELVGDGEVHGDRELDGADGDDDRGSTRGELVGDLARGTAFPGGELAGDCERDAAFAGQRQRETDGDDDRGDDDRGDDDRGDGDRAHDGKAFRSFAQSVASARDDGEHDAAATDGGKHDAAATDGSDPGDGATGRDAPNLDGEGTLPEGQRAPLNALDRLRGIPLAQQLKVARGPSASERMAVERLYGKNVWDALLRNPGLTAPEVARLSRLGTLPRVLLEVIVTNNTWLQVPEVRRALLSNPRLGTDQITRVLRLLPKHELKLASTIPAYPHSVRSLAKKMIKDNE